MKDNIIWNKGFKKTKQREIVFSILAKADTPLTAAQIYSMAEREGTQIWLSTVYRILELFTRRGITEKMVLSGDETASYALLSEKHRHYAVCKECRRVVPLDICPMEKALDLDGFHMTNHTLEITGYCSKCFSENG